MKKIIRLDREEIKHITEILLDEIHRRRKLVEDRKYLPDYEMLAVDLLKKFK